MAKEHEKIAEMTMERMEEIRKAVSDFRNTVATRIKDLHTEIKDWRFAMETHEEGVVVDVSVRLLIKQKEKK
jgi:hypothetical protein